LQSSLSRPYVVTVIPAAPTEARTTTVSDLLIGSVSMAGLMLGVALVLGVVFGGIRLALKRYFPSGGDHMPPVSPFEPDSTTSPRSSPPQ
jgi:hypothetical protein